MGRLTIARRVVDTNGNGIANVELRVGKQTVYTGAVCHSGVFMARHIK
jgi:hypothetical protein